MEQAGSQELQPSARQDGLPPHRSEEEGKRSRPGFARFLTTWIRVVVGLALVAEGAVLFADARTHWVGHGAWVGMAAMAAGALLGLSGVWAISVQVRGPRGAPTEGLPAAPELVVPMLGALLVYKYKLITEEQLEKALETQHKDSEPRRRLGTILLDMGLVSMAEIQAALAYQRSLTIQPSAPGGNDG
jgi:hypothetical protein